MKHHKTLICALALVTLGFNTYADTIYDSFGAANGNAFSMGNGQEIGNQITISPNSWSLTNFTIEYYSPNASFSANVGIDVRFYYNDGTPTNGFAAPGTLFFDSGWFFNGGSLPANGYRTVTYTGTDFYGGSLVNMPNGFLLPGTFTFTVSFTNVDNLNNQVNLPLANNISNNLVRSFGDYWLNNNGNWTLMTNATSAANFVVDIGAVPEPSTFALIGLGSVALLGINKLRRKS